MLHTTALDVATTTELPRGNLSKSCPGDKWMGEVTNTKRTNPFSQIGYYCKKNVQDPATRLLVVQARRPLHAPESQVPSLTLQLSNALLD